MAMPVVSLKMGLSDRTPEFNIQPIDKKDTGSSFASSQYARFPTDHRRWRPAGIFSAKQALTPLFLWQWFVSQECWWRLA